MYTFTIHYNANTPRVELAADLVCADTYATYDDAEIAAEVAILELEETRPDLAGHLEYEVVVAEDEDED